MAQPNVLANVTQNNTFRGRGLNARFLCCMLKSYVGSRRYRTAEIPDETYQSYERLIKNLLSEEPDNMPQTITLSADADALLCAFAEDLEPKIVTDYQDIKDWVGKLVGSVARISGLLCRAENHRSYEFLSCPDPLVVSGETMQKTIRIGEYFLEHAKASFSLMGADEGVKNCKYVLEAIKKSGLAEFTRRDIMRLCRALGTVGKIQPVLDHLVDYGYLAPKDTGAFTGKGRPPVQTYLVNPKIYDK